MTVFVVLTCGVLDFEQRFYNKAAISEAGDATNSNQTETETEKRTRTLTEKTAKNYETRKTEFQTKIQNAWDKVAQFLSDNIDIPATTNVEGLNNLEKELSKLSSVYRSVIKEHIAYLIRVGIQDSLKESRNFLAQFEQSQKLYKLYQNKRK